MMGQITWDRRCLLLSNHALVLAVIAADPRVRVKEIASASRYPSVPSSRY